MCGFTGFLVNNKFDRILFNQTLNNQNELSYNKLIQ